MKAGIIVISRPATFTVPPIPIPVTFFTPLRSSHCDNSNTASIGALVARATLMMSPV